MVEPRHFNGAVVFYPAHCGYMQGAGLCADGWRSGGMIARIVDGI